MGAGQSGGIEIGGSTMGYQVLRVYPDSPGSRAGLKAYFDFIVAIGNTRFNKENGSFREILKASVDQKLKMVVYNTRTKSVRDVEILPSTNWGGNGLLGVSIKHSSFDRADERVWHVVEVEPGSPAQQAGFKAGEDYVIGSDSILQENDDLYNLIETHEGKALKLFVYNVNLDNCREVICHPNSKWGGRGYLGCEFGHGLLHRIPYVSDGEDMSSNPKASLLRNEQPMAKQELPAGSINNSRSLAGPNPTIPIFLGSRPATSGAPTQSSQSSGAFSFQSQLMHQQNNTTRIPAQPGHQLFQQALLSQPKHQQNQQQAIQQQGQQLPQQAPKAPSPVAQQQPLMQNQPAPPAQKIHEPLLSPYPVQPQLSQMPSTSSQQYPTPPTLGQPQAFNQTQQQQQLPPPPQQPIRSYEPPPMGPPPVRQAPSPQSSSQLQAEQPAPPPPVPQTFEQLSLYQQYLQQQRPITPPHKQPSPPNQQVSPGVPEVGPPPSAPQQQHQPAQPPAQHPSPPPLQAPQTFAQLGSMPPFQPQPYQIGQSHAGRHYPPPPPPPMQVEPPPLASPATGPPPGEGGPTSDQNMSNGINPAQPQQQQQYPPHYGMPQLPT